MPKKAKAQKLATHFYAEDLTYLYAASNLCGQFFAPDPPERLDHLKWFAPGQTGTQGVSLTPKHLHRMAEDLGYLHGFIEAGLIQMGDADGTVWSKEKMQTPVRALIVRMAEALGVTVSLEPALKLAADRAREVYAEVLADHAEMGVEAKQGKA